MTNNENQIKEDKLVNDGLQLLSNGHRMTYVFKYIRERAEDDEMRQRIMQRITSNNQAQEINQARLEHDTAKKSISWTELIIGLCVIAFAMFITRMLWDMGWVSTLPLIMMGAVFVVWSKRR